MVTIDENGNNVNVWTESLRLNQPTLFIYGSEKEIYE